MSEVGIRALKQNASAVVAEAAAGETVTITDRGRPVAQMAAILSFRAVRRDAPDRVVRAREVLDAMTLTEIATATFETAGRPEPSAYRCSSSSASRSSTGRSQVGHHRRVSSVVPQVLCALCAPSDGPLPA